MPAFEAAIAAGADGIEFDVQLSRDGVPVIIHDDTLTRTHGVRKRVVDLTGAELRDLGIPSLREFFELMAGNDLRIYLEIKSREPELPQVCSQMVREFGFEERTIVECFELEMLRGVELITAALFEPRVFADRSIVERTLAVGAKVLALHQRLAKPPLVAKAKAAGLTIVVWTVDDPAWLARARAMKIEAVITNDPARMLTA